MSLPAGTPYPVVLQVLPALESGGVERGTIEITEAIARSGGMPLVASAGGNLTVAVECAGGKNIIMRLDSKNPWRIWRNAARLAKVIRREQVEIVHARSRAPAWSAWLAAKRTGAHFVTTYHGTYSEKGPFKRRYNSIMARGERIIAISRHIAHLLTTQHGIPADRIRVIVRGVDPAIFDPTIISGDRMMKLARAWRLPDAMTVIMLPGRLTRWKGQSVLIEALAKLKHTDTCAVLVGSDQGRRSYAADLEKLAERHGVADRVRIVGHCDDMAAALALADIVVNASTEPEGFGRVVIEAQSMAKPVVASDHGGAVETIEHDVTGLRVPPGDAARLAEALDWLLDLDPADRAAFGERARAAVKAHFTVRAMQEATIDVYREILT